MKKIVGALSLIILTLITGCGGGSGGGGGTAPPTTVVIKISSQEGGLPAGKAVSGIGVTLELPPGVTPRTVAGGAVDTTVVTTSGLLAGAAGTMAPVIYTPATATARAKLDLYFYSMAPSGVGVGEFATISLMLAGVSPTVTDFNVSSFTPVDLSFALIPTLTYKLGLSVF